MTLPQLGLLLRLIGPLLQIVSLILLRVEDVRREAIYALFLLGFGMVIIGIGLSREAPRATSRRSGDDEEFHL